MFGEMVSVGAFEVTDGRQQNYTFIVESRRSWNLLVAVGGKPSYFCILLGVLWPASYMPGPPEIQRSSSCS